MRRGYPGHRHSGRGHAQTGRRGDGTETHVKLPGPPGHLYQRVFAGLGKRGRSGHKRALPLEAVQSHGAGPPGARNPGPDQSRKAGKVVSFQTFNEFHNHPHLHFMRYFHRSEIPKCVLSSASRSLCWNQVTSTKLRAF